jgi:type IV secretory pathway protease TraF
MNGRCGTILTALAAAALLLSTIGGTSPRYMWNASKSVPIGLYRLLKRVLALPGQTVCRTGLTIVVDGIDVGEALERDGRGRPLPVWQGCRAIGEDELFVMNWQSADSLDSRYFGPLPASAVIGRVVPMWTNEE